MAPTQFIDSFKRILILPYPEIVFLDIVRVWNTFSNIKIDTNELFSWIKNNVYVREINIKSNAWTVGGGVKLNGFMGHVGFKIKDNRLLNWIHTLAKYGEFSNVGYRRHLGMGVINVVNKAN